MKKNETKTASYSEPLTVNGLTVVFKYSNKNITDSQLLALSGGMKKNIIEVHETSNVNELLIENISEEFDVFVQVGDILRGGKQDRTIGTDFIVPKKSGKIPLPSFCVEQSRWCKRGVEDVFKFGSSTKAAYAKSLKRAIMQDKSQHKVWESVHHETIKLSAKTGGNTASALSPSSYELMMDHEAVRKNIDQTLAELKLKLAHAPSPENSKPLCGCFIYIYGKLYSYDLYSLPSLFEQMKDKILDGAAGALMSENGEAYEPDPKFILKQIKNVEKQVSVMQALTRRDLPPRTRITETHESKCYIYRCYDRENVYSSDEEPLHTCFISE